MHGVDRPESAWYKETMNETNLPDPFLDDDNEPQECCVPGCTNVGPTAICFEHLPPGRFEPDYDPNGEEERHYQHGL